MSDCEIWNERLALRMYGELDAGDFYELEAHLSACAGCRARERELAEGLGRLRDSAPREADDALARERLRRAPAREVRFRAPALSPALAGFAAGVLCALGLTALLNPGTVPQETSRGEPAPVFARATPPPAASDRGLGAVLANVARR